MNSEVQTQKIVDGTSFDDVMLYSFSARVLKGVNPSLCRFQLKQDADINHYTLPNNFLDRTSLGTGALPAVRCMRADLKERS